MSGNLISHAEKAVIEKPRNLKTKKPPVKRLLYPGLIFVALVTQIPFIMTIYFSLHSWNVVRPDLGIHFVGLANYLHYFTQPQFYTVLKNTLILTFGALILCLVLGIIFALLMNRQFFAKGIVRTMFVSPFFVMPAVAGIVWKTMVVNPNYGFSAYFGKLTHSVPIDWLGQHPLFIVVLIVTWLWTPFFMLVLLAGLQSLPQDLLEAAEIDGANKGQQLLYIVLPHLLNYFEVVIMLGLIFILQVFGEIFVTTSGGPGYASTNLSYYTYREGFQNWEIGGASTIGVITVILTMIVMTFLFSFMRRRFKEELT